jgi:hypothetical protein
MAEAACPNCGATTLEISIRLGAGGAPADMTLKCKGCGRSVSASALKGGAGSSPAPSPAAAPAAPERLGARLQSKPQPLSAAPAEGASEPRETLHPPLLDYATPGLYRGNAFRVTGLSTGAGSREITKHGQKLEMMARLGTPAPAQAAAFPLDPPPDGDALRQAIQVLQDPERRLVHELFWFWAKPDGEADPAMQALAKGDEGNARKLWGDRAQSGGSTASHNLAVLDHMMALDLEGAGEARRLDKAERDRRDAAWANALQRWAALCEDGAFRKRLRERIRALEDPRLTERTLEQLLATLPLALLGINARLGAHAAEKGSRGEAERQRRLVERSGFGERAAAEALRRAVEPIADRIRTLCKTAEPEADAKPASADKLARRVLDQSKPLLAALDLLLPKEHPTRVGSHDEVALRALACQISYGNHTKDWDGSEALLNDALPIAHSESARQRIQENLNIVKGNQKFGTCWFCGTAKAEDGCERDVKLHGNVTRTPNYFAGTVQVQWQKLTIGVPRCGGCKGRHGRADMSLGFSVLFGFLSGIGSCIARGGEGNAPGVAIGLIIVFGALGGWLRWQLLGGVKDESAGHEFPSVKEKLSQGYALGDQPADVTS